MLKCFCGDHKHAHIPTHFCLTSTFSCTGQTGWSQFKLDFGQKADRSLTCIFLIVCLLVTLAYWIFSFLFWGLLVVFPFWGDSLLVRWIQRTGFQGQNWTRQSDRVTKEKTEDSNRSGLTANVAASMLGINTALHPSTQQLMTKSSHWVWLGENWTVASIYSWFILLVFVVTYSKSYISSFYHCVGLYSYRFLLSMPNSVLGHWHFRTWLLNVFYFLLRFYSLYGECVEFTCILYIVSTVFPVVHDSTWVAWTVAVEFEWYFMIFALHLTIQLLASF